MNIVVFSGAGMSAESGISTFRDANGLWANHKIEEFATPEAWLKNPEKVQQFYNQRRKQILESSPNEAHMLIKELEKIGNVTVITQKDRKSTRLNSSHITSSYAVFCLKKK